MNVLIVSGIATKEPEHKEKCTILSVADNGYKDESQFFDFLVFDKTAEFCEQYVKKGSRLTVMAQVRTAKQDKKQKIYIAEKISFI